RRRSPLGCGTKPLLSLNSAGCGPDCTTGGTVYVMTAGSTPQSFNCAASGGLSKKTRVRRHFEGTPKWAHGFPNSAKRHPLLHSQPIKAPTVHPAGNAAASEIAKL